MTQTALVIYEYNRSIFTFRWKNTNYWIWSSPKLKLGKFSTDIFEESSYSVNISRANFKYVFITFPLFNILFWKNGVIFSEKLLFQLCQKVSLKPFMQLVDGKHSSGKEWRVKQWSSARKETVDKDILITRENGDQNIMQRLISNNELTFHENKKMEPFCRFRWASTKVIPIEKTMSKGSREVVSEKATFLPTCFCSLCNISKQ